MLESFVRTALLPDCVYPYFTFMANTFYAVRLCNPRLGAVVLVGWLFFPPPLPPGHRKSEKFPCFITQLSRSVFLDLKEFILIVCSCVRTHTHTLSQDTLNIISFFVCFLVSCHIFFLLCYCSGQLQTLPVFISGKPPPCPAEVARPPVLKK